MEDPVVPLERNLYGHPLAGLLWERQFEKVLLKHGWEKVLNWECLFVHREKGIILICNPDTKLSRSREMAEISLVEKMSYLQFQMHFDESIQSKPTV